MEPMRQLASSMLRSIEAAQNKSADERCHSIFKVPRTLAKGVAEECRPHAISIGPYHHGKKPLQMLQRCKWRYLHAMLNRTQPSQSQLSVHLKNLINVVASKEEKIRRCYSESTNHFSGPDLVKMMVLDGCFIIEFLFQLERFVEPNHILLTNSFVLVSISRDLLRLENQIPYFVLEDLFELTNIPQEISSLSDLACRFFRRFGDGLVNVKERRITLKAVHLLDLLRLSLDPSDQSPGVPSIGCDESVTSGQQDSPEQQSSYVHPFGSAYASVSSLHSIGSTPDSVTFVHSIKSPLESVTSDLQDIPDYQGVFFHSIVEPTQEASGSVTSDQHDIPEYQVFFVKPTQEENPGEVYMIRSASELHQVGIRFKQRKDSSFLKIKFNRLRRTIGIPKIAIFDGELKWILINMVAFEQCSGQVGKHVTAYAMFIRCLLRTADDVRLLRDFKVISNLGMSNDDFVQCFGDICRDVQLNFARTYLSSEAEAINKSLQPEWAYRCWAVLRNAFRENPWSIFSFFTVGLSLLGVIQLVNTILQLKNPK